MQVRRFEDSDAEALADLMIEMAGSYGATIRSDLVVVKDILRQARKVDIIVAHDDARLLGFATFTSLYPVAGLLAFTYVQQIYVGQAARRLGVAQDLMAGVAQAAKAAGSTRVEWSTSTGNITARSLYDGLGAAKSDKVYYVLDGVALEQMATRGQPGDQVRLPPITDVQDND
ncbi:GNAT family N-acetyltransferase [Methylobacterium sp. Leaf469]|uniref:GNAT family N-acetyltransferase n=1 Tax=Methylobacterium sp. Leaf469 TaxID=1736387 RepID=UPI000AF300B9|nr:GNAT family N-acetyltransferase [Methylobacterium sp. Leaf469]